MEALAECLEWPNGSVVVTYKHRDVQYRNANEPGLALISSNGWRTETG